MRTPLRALAALCLLLLLAPVAVSAPAGAAPDSSALGGWLRLVRVIVDPLGANEIRVEPGWRASADLRLRQEVLDRLFYFTPDEPDRNWIRLRSRAGFAYGWGNAHEIEARLCSEFRRIITPDTPLNYDEIILDRLLYRYHAWPSATVTLGRQDITWDDGFLVLDGTPLDGSRSAYMNALRLRLGDDDTEPGLTELFVAYNPAYDDLVLWDDDLKRRLADGDETAAALRLRPRRNQQLALIWKRERDPDHRRPALDAWTLGYRGERTRGTANVMGELAIQFQDWSGAGVDQSGLAWALQLRLRRVLNAQRRVDLGLFGYSGHDGDQLAFRTPWGRWPKWNELMLYRLIGEGGVGLWANLGGAWAEIQQSRDGKLLGVGLQALTALAPASSFRDLLLRVRVELPLLARLNTQFLMESPFFAGYDGVSYVPAYGSNPPRRIDPLGGFFLRWQVTYATK